MKKLGTVNQNQDKQGKIISKLIKTWSFFLFFCCFFSEKTVVLYTDNVQNAPFWF